MSVWNDEIYFYPDSSTDYRSTTLDGEISDSATTITVASTTNFPLQNGRITIGPEKIRYESKSSTQFLNCTRGLENTTAQLHETAAEVKENNLMIFYFKMVKKITVDENDVVFPEDMERELPIAEEHMISIIDLTTYMLLMKIDAVRAEPYKMDAGSFLDRAKEDIEWGRSDITSGLMISSPFDFEVNNVGVTM